MFVDGVGGELSSGLAELEGCDGVSVVNSFTGAGAAVVGLSASSFD